MSMTHTGVFVVIVNAMSAGFWEYGMSSTPHICAIVRGRILSLVILYEIESIKRFPRVQDFVSYCRLVKSAKESNGKKYGSSGKKIGNAHIKWAFS